MNFLNIYTINLSLVDSVSQSLFKGPIYLKANKLCFSDVLALFQYYHIKVLYNPNKAS